MRKILLAWSGGKDAAWALHHLRGREDVEVVGLLTTVNSDFQRVAMHGIRREVLHAQSRSTGLPLLESAIPHGSDNDTYEAAFAASLAEARERWPDIDSLAFGDLLLADVRAWRQALCARYGWSILTPLFGRDTTALVQEMLDGGLRTRLCCVDTRQLDARFAGRPLDRLLLAELPAGVDHCGENGEFHTLVEDGPMFTTPLALQRGETVLRDGRFAFTDFFLPDPAHAMR